MTDLREIRVGDWVSFQRHGYFKVAKVGHISPHLTSDSATIFTNEGAVLPRDILEVRGPGPSCICGLASLMRQTEEAKERAARATADTALPAAPSPQTVNRRRRRGDGERDDGAHGGEQKAGTCSIPPGVPHEPEAVREGPLPALWTGNQHCGRCVGEPPEGVHRPRRPHPGARPMTETRNRWLERRRDPLRPRIELEIRPIATADAAAEAAKGE